ncbi:MAG: rhodanese-like domain-containing protein [Ilumatobacter sp.]|nr:rhodanese-like domain-containing protein [Ilumatobacter sp.]
MHGSRRFTIVFGIALAIAACGGSDAAPAEPVGSASVVSSPAGIVLVSPADAASTIAAPLDDLVILDVRTPEEFAEGHIDGAVMIDFYRADFADELAKLDPDVPYVLYCRSGNRSGQTAAMMDQLGFESVQDVDGGILAWQQAGLPLTTD